MANNSDDDCFPRYPTGWPKTSGGHVASAIPSSPPQPQPTGVRSGPSSEFRFGLGFRRKRSHSTSHNSSDMATFSSDDLENADIHNYQDGPRFKRTVRGPWWKSPSKGPAGRSALHQSHAAPSASPCPRKKKTNRTGGLDRQMDSGVWGLWSESESMDGFSDDVLALSTPTRLTPTCACASEQEAKTARQVQTLVDQDCDRINLSDMSLVKLHSSTLDPLNTIIRRPPRINDIALRTPMSTPQYQTLRPSIRLFLSKNLLSGLPVGLWNIENLTFLSVRNNRLRELPACVANLPNLQHLNVAANQLRWLPFELIAMLRKADGTGGKLEELIVDPNPFIRPVSVDPACRSNCAVQKTVVGRTKAARKLIGKTRDRVAFVAASQVSVSGPDGLPEIDSWEQMASRSDGHGRDDGSVDSDVVEAVFERASDGRAERFVRSRVPSLQELALRSLAGMITTTAPFRSACPPTGIAAILTALGLEDVMIPKGLANPIERAAAAATELSVLGSRPGLGLAADTRIGSDAATPARLFSSPVSAIRSPTSKCLTVSSPADRISTRCSVCRTGFVMHRAAWLEYWLLSDGDAPSEVGLPSTDPFGPQSGQNGGTTSRTSSVEDDDCQDLSTILTGITPFVRRVCCTACIAPTQT